MADESYNPYNLPLPTDDTSLFDLPQVAVDDINAASPWPTPTPYEVVLRNARQRQQSIQQRNADLQKQEDDRRNQLAASRMQMLNELASPKQPAVKPAEPKKPEVKDEGVGGNALKAAGQELSSIALNAEAAANLNNPLKLIELAQRKKALDEAAPEGQKKFREGIKGDGSLWDYLKSLGGSAYDNPEGAFDSAVQFAINAGTTFVLPELAGNVAGLPAGGVGALVGGPLAVAGVQGALSSGEMGMALLLKQAQKDGVDLANKQQIAEWVKTQGVQDVFGKAAKAGLTNGAIMGLTLGLAKYAGNAAGRLLGQSGKTVEEAQSFGPLTPGMVGEAEARGNTLLNQARLAKAGQIVGGSTGFGAASAASSLMAGEDVDMNSVWINGMMYLVPSLFGVRPYFRGLKTEVPKAGEVGKAVEPVPPKGGGGGVELTEQEIEANARKAIAAAKAEKAKVPEAVKAAAETPAGEEKPAPVTPEQIAKIEPFTGPPEDAATALRVVQEAEKDAINETLTKEAAERAAKSSTAAVEPPAAVEPTDIKPPTATTDVAAAATPDQVSTEGANRPASDGTVQQGTGGEVGQGPGRAGGVGVNQEGIRQGLEGQPRSGEPTGGVGAGSAAVVGESHVPSSGAPRKTRTRVKKNPLLAGREATEEANRKTQKEIDDALKSESEGGDIFEDLSNRGNPTTGRRLRTTFNRYALLKATERDVIDAVDAHLKTLDDKRLTSQDRIRGADYVRERLLNARRTGELDDAQADLALWLLNQAPHLGNDLAFSIRRGENATSRGTYDSLRRLVTIFSEQAGDDTVTHEILHHTEPMMPRVVQDGIRKEWLKELRNKINETLTHLKEGTYDTESAGDWQGKPREASLYLRVMLKAAEAGDYDLTKSMWNSIKDGQGVVRNGLGEFLDYRMVSPSEFWAVDGPKILRARMNADTWVRKAIEWLREFYQKARSLFGLESDAPVIRALDELINGTGELKTKQLIDRSMITRDATEQKEQGTKQAKEINDKGIGDVVGRKDGIDKIRAWDNGDGTYRTYPVLPDGSTGGKETKVDVNESELKKYIEDQGLEFTDRSARGFNQEPVGNKKLIVRWKADAQGIPKVVYTAVKNDDGTWSAQKGEDLNTNSRTATRETLDFETKKDALAAANEISTHETLQAARNDFETTAPRNLLAKAGVSNVAKVGVASDTMLKMMNANAPIDYTAGAADTIMKSIGSSLPPALRVGVQYMLKVTDLGHQWLQTLNTEVKPLIKTTRDYISKYGYKGEEGYKQLNQDVSDIAVLERFPKLLPKLDPTLDPKYTAANLAKSEAAQKRLARLSDEQRADLYKLMRQWKPFSDKTIDLMYQYERIDKSAAQRIKNAYQIYAPLIKEGKGRKLTATGTSAEGSNVFERMIEARGAALRQGIDNRAINTLAKLAKVFEFVNPDGTKIFKDEPIDREHLVHDPVTGMIDISTAMDPRKTIQYYEGGVPKRIQLNGDVGDQLLKVINKFPEQERDTALRAALGYAGFFTRMFGVLHTSMSPTFAVKNFVRDLGTNVAQLDPRIKYTELRKAMVNPDVWSAAVRLGFRHAAEVLGKDSVKGHSLAEAADRDGALIAQHYQYGVEQIPNDHAISLRPSIKTVAKEYLAPTDGKLTNFLTGITHTLEAVNRIAVYKAAIESGIPAREAGTLAKDATTNFERRGEWAPNITPFYAFANAKMQGARTLGEKLGFTDIGGAGTGGFVKGLKGLLPGTKNVVSANPRTVRAAQLALALGLVAAYANYKSSKKDADGRTLHGKRSEYQLDNYLYIPGTDYTIPIPQELGTFYNMGSSMGDAIWGDRAGSASGAMTRFVTAQLQNFNPGGTSMHDPIGPNGEGVDYAFRLAMPTQALAAYDIVTNRDTFGRKVNPDRDRTDIPPEMQGAKTASQPANLLARGMGVVGIDSSPRNIDHFLKSIFKQQAPLYNLVTQGSVGELAKDTFKGFYQPPFVGTTKLDYDNVLQKVQQQAAREAGSPLKKKQYSGIAREFANVDEQIKKLRTQYSKTESPEVKKRIDEQQDALRSRVLKKYYEQTGVIQP